MNFAQINIRFLNDLTFVTFFLIRQSKPWSKWRQNSVAPPGQRNSGHSGKMQQVIQGRTQKFGKGGGFAPIEGKTALPTSSCRPKKKKKLLGMKVKRSKLFRAGGSAPMLAMYMGCGPQKKEIGFNVQPVWIGRHSPAEIAVGEILF